MTGETAQERARRYARAIVDGDTSRVTVGHLEGALLDLSDVAPLSLELDELAYATAMYNPYLGAPYLDHSAMVTAVRDSGLIDGLRSR